MECKGYHTKGWRSGKKCIRSAIHTVNGQEFCSDHFIMAMDGMRYGHKPECPANFDKRCNCGADEKPKEEK